MTTGLPTVSVSGMQSLRLTDKTAVITGAASGIGLKIAGRFAAEGARLVLADIDIEGVTAAARSITEAGYAALAMRADVACADDVQRMFDEARERLGSLDILVNNAGTGLNRPFLDTSLAEWNHLLNVNLTGTFLCAQAAARIMVKQASGRIVNVASISGQRGAQGRAAYGAAKAGVIQLTKVMAVELGPRGVCVNAVSPGPVDTPQSRQTHTSGTRQSYLSRIPLHRYGDRAEIAAAVLFLASDEASFVNGHVLNVDGGFYGAGLTFED